MICDICYLSSLSESGSNVNTILMFNYNSLMCYMTYRYTLISGQTELNLNPCVCV